MVVVCRGAKGGQADLAVRGEGSLWQPGANGAMSTPGGLITGSDAALVSACSGAASLNSLGKP